MTALEEYMLWVDRQLHDSSNSIPAVISSLAKFDEKMQIVEAYQAGREAAASECAEIRMRTGFDYYNEKFKHEPTIRPQDN